MTNFTRATPLFLATTLILGSSAAYADHGSRNNDVEDLLLNVASAFLVTQTTQHATLVRNQRSRHGHGHEYRRDRDNPRAVLAAETPIAMAIPKRASLAIL
jgi:hypothetical protein